MSATGTHAHDLPATLPVPDLPVSQLESLKFKANQIIESIYALQRTIEAGGNPAAMPAWPDILSKYNILLSQTHNFSNALVNPIPSRAGGSTGSAPLNIYERISLHPSVGMPDARLDADVIPLLRNQQTTDVLRVENETVRRLSEHMKSRGSVGVLGPPPPSAQPAPYMNGHGFGLAYAGFGQKQKKPEYEDVLRECAEVRGDHDRRVARAVRAVTMLREKFDWKQRVEVEVEEPEELEWDPRLGMRPHQAPVPPNEADDDIGMESADEEGDGDGDGDDKDGSSDEDDEFNVEGELVNLVGMDGLSPGVFPTSTVDPPETSNPDVRMEETL
ncbi:uncharacterized protein LACBIDRAFT_293774 [Laccaria bicolor S238N-H82]|uniref:Predicted protein n=1 Tax=Laccaria bicolor (strain S238N-H82 / ATCC MYA-4686) TaxID=486041 RepID=B0D6H4_LACBS|nr:uncharacterized protein LACBIDRAFT_293774 [Laccaria bicolor S238N-H82]EDR10189.1 predicted protein [Laccaria bicolor S238N-H82]|eukprot:XP_001879574.1 predicted protein [Laccaria bicolor S238N-H82]